MTEVRQDGVKQYLDTRGATALIAFSEQQIRKCSSVRDDEWLKMNGYTT